MLDLAGSVWHDFWILLLGVEGEEQRMDDGFGLDSKPSLALLGQAN